MGWAIALITLGFLAIPAGVGDIAWFFWLSGGAILFFKFRSAKKDLRGRRIQ